VAIKAKEHMNDQEQIQIFKRWRNLDLFSMTMGLIALILTIISYEQDVAIFEVTMEYKAG
jgi:hypothetical protein